MENHGLFEKYLDGSLSENDRNDFHKRLAEDQDFEHQFRTYTKIDDLIKKNKKRQEFKATLNEVADEYFKSIDSSSIKNNSYKLLFKVAATITIVIALGISFYFYFNTHPTNKELYAENYSPLKIDLITRSANDSVSIIKNAYILYQTKDYAGCIKVLSSNNISDSIITSANIIQGLSYMELGNFNKAEILLTAASKDQNNILHEDCLWYLSLLYLNMDKPDKSIPLLYSLIENQSSYSEKAKTILSKLKK